MPPLFRLTYMALELPKESSKSLGGSNSIGLSIGYYLHNYLEQGLVFVTITSLSSIPSPIFL